MDDIVPMYYLTCPRTKQLSACATLKRLCFRSMHLRTLADAATLQHALAYACWHMVQDCVRLHDHPFSRSKPSLITEAGRIRARATFPRARSLDSLQPNYFPHAKPKAEVPLHGIGRSAPPALLTQVRHQDLLYKVALLLCSLYIFALGATIT